MGVHGLWKLLEPSGQMVPLESLSGKVLAVDVSIWLHQAVKGVQDAHGAPVAVSHLLILFHRLCKLLFYRIKPVFVFDGGVPALKHQTMASRRQQTRVAKNEAMKVREKLIKNLLKHEAVRQVLLNETASAALGLNSFVLPGPSVEEDLYKLPSTAADCVDSESSENLSSSGEESEKHTEDIHSIDVTSKEFLSLPAEVRHDILTELIDTRKQSSWKYLDDMPKKSDSFSDFQMNRLLKRRAVQTSLEEAGKEMGGRALSLKELESLLGDQGILDPKADVPGKRIAQDNVTRFVLVQKNSTSEPTEKKEVEDGKFNIMNHLEEIDWSSESDTDVILRKSSERITLAEESENPQQKVVKIKTEPGLLSKQPKVRMSEEIADILTIPEDEDVAGDIKVKVEDLQSKIHIEVETKVEHSVERDKNLANPKLSESPNVLVTVFRVVPGKSEEDSIKVDENSSAEKMETTSEIQPVSPKVPAGEPSVNPESPKKNTNDAVTIPIPDLGKKKKLVVEKSFEGEVEHPSENQPNTPMSPNKLQDSTDFSSESENDFVMVTEPESFKNVPTTESFEAMSVTINPTKIGEDDIFADVFQEKTDGGDEIEAKELINEYKTEFQKMSRDDFTDLKKTLEEQQRDLVREQGKQERHALNPTDQMYSDAQELLKLFGVPFVVAPMEAEAQCAALDVIGLTEGTITDDSDIWLFGGRVVYKNFFNQNKHVLEYRSENIHKYFKLTREDLIKIAILVGSDYTIGLNGIGPVTALEILAAFQTSNQDLLEGLQKFGDWFTGKTKTGPIRATLKKKIRNTVISPGFPSRAVAEAYLRPHVDDSKEPFSWAKPNLDLIRKYVKMKMNWSSEKCNEFLLPVMKKLEEGKNQHTMEKYYRIAQKTSSIEGMLSKRVESAIKRLGGDAMEETEVDPENTKPKKRQKVKKAKEKEGSFKNTEEREEGAKVLKKPKTNGKKVPVSCSGSSSNERLSLINKRLHQDVKIPQKEMTQKMLEERRKQAVEIFRTYKKRGRKKTKVYAKEEANLSESSGKDD